MNVLILCDGFKGSLSSGKANEAIKISANKLGFNAKTFAISDGGEGFLQAIQNNILASKITLRLKNAFGKRDYDGYYLLSENKAYFEMAEFAGIAQLLDEEKNVLKTSTYSLGLAIKDALDKGVNDFVIGLGGSATNDAGIGMLTALGLRFLDENEKELEPIGENLIKIKKIDTNSLDKRAKKAKFYLASDVENPLYGSNGAAFIYAAQKGAKPSDIVLLDEGLKNLAQIASIQKDRSKKDCSCVKGAGAAGGLGYGFLQFLDARIGSGFNYLADILRLAKEIKNADLIISGEGAFDKQSLMGKAVGKIISLAKDKKCLIFCGINNSDYTYAYSLKEHFKGLLHDELMQEEIAFRCLSELAFDILKKNKK